MLRTLLPSLIFSICIVIILQVTAAQNDAEEDILELLNEIKNEEHKSLQQLREELLWQHQLSNHFLGTERTFNPKLIKRQNPQHMLWNKMGKVLAGDDIESLLNGGGGGGGKRSPWGMQPFENTLYQYPSNDEPSNVDSHIKAAKRNNAQQRLWSLLAAASDERVSNVSSAGKRSPIVKRPDAQQLFWAKMGSILQNNGQLGSLAASGKRSPLGTNVKGQHMFFNTIRDLYRDPRVWTSLKTANGDSTSPGQPSRLDETDFVEDILRQQGANDY